ncbi:MAG: alpha/beta hydrolase [Bacteroidota bacterium]
MKTLSFNGRKIAYKIEGKGFPVVLLHGFCEDRKVWEDFKLDLLEERYRVLAIDLPGFGDSEPIEKASIANYAKAVIAVIEACKLEQVVLIGHSMGGYTALSVAELAPEKLLGLGLFHSHPYADTPEKQASRYKQIQLVEKYGHQLYVKQLVPKLFPPNYGKSRPFDLDKLIHRAARYSSEGIIGGLQAMLSRADQSEMLQSISCPVLFIVGGLDEAIPNSASLDQLSLPPVASIHILPEVAHMGMLEARRPIQLMVRQFVDFCLK